MSDGKLARWDFFLFLVLIVLCAIVWLLFQVDAKLQAFGAMINNASKREEQQRLTD